MSAGSLSIFFVGERVDDLEVLHVVVGVSPEGQFHAVGFLDADEQLGGLYSKNSPASP